MLALRFLFFCLSEGARVRGLRSSPSQRALSPQKLITKVFGLEDNQKAKASRIIKDTTEKGWIKPVDKDTAPRYMRYIPYWA